MPKIYHITPVENLTKIVEDGRLLCDRAIRERGGPALTIGMLKIKRRRIDELEVDCHPGTMVGDYVPFFFCPRSVMLFVISCRNHPDLEYLGGQEPIIHLEADLHAVVRWAKERGVRWAFSLSNAGARFTEFRCHLEDLDELDWEAIEARIWPKVKEAKQAEFLVYEVFPFDLVERIGVHSAEMLTRVRGALRGADHPPVVEIRRDWYY